MYFVIKFCSHFISSRWWCEWLWKCVRNEHNEHRCIATPCRIYTWNLECSFVWFVLNKFDIIFTGLMWISKIRKMMDSVRCAWVQRMHELSRTVITLLLKVNSRFEIEFPFCVPWLNAACCLLTAGCWFDFFFLIQMSWFIRDVPIEAIFHSNHVASRNQKFTLNILEICRKSTWSFQKYSKAAENENSKTFCVFFLISSQCVIETSWRMWWVIVYCILHIIYALRSLPVALVIFSWSSNITWLSHD